jgi:hypothetical protein
MAGASAWPSNQHQPRQLVLRRLVCRCDHRSRRRHLAVASGGDGTWRHRSARGYVRATCPESPYWVRAQDRKRRIADTLAAGGTLSSEDRTWSTKADKVGIRQVFMPDVLSATLVATFVTCCSCCIYGTVGAWMPLYLSTEKHWSTAEYSTFYASSDFSGSARPAGSPTRLAGESAL